MNNNFLLSGIWEELKELLSFRIDDLSQTSSVNRLTLLVSQNCPLDCIYCYGQKGTYGNPGQMNSSVAKQTISTFLDIFSSIRAIQFFGGEPLLNLMVVENTVKYLREFIKKYNIKNKPRIFLVTGLGVSILKMKYLEKFLKDYPEFEITVSCDGPPEIHNILRPFRNGKPSFEIVAKNIDLLRQLNQPKAIEVTYTKVHLDNNVSLLDVRDFFEKRFGIQNLIIVPVMFANSLLSIPNNQMKDLFYDKLWAVKMVEYGKGIEKGKGIKLLKYFANEILNMHPLPYLCDAGFSNFAVDTEGDIYPCHLVVNKKEFKIGNVYDEKEKLKDLFSVYAKKYRELSDKRKDKRCMNCFLEYFCLGCPFGYYLEKGTFTIPHDYCKIKKGMTQSILYAYVNLTGGKRHEKNLQ